MIIKEEKQGDWQRQADQMQEMLDTQGLIRGALQGQANDVELAVI